MRASLYQQAAGATLSQHFAEVVVEWSVAQGATDLLAADPLRYAPRVDIAIGPFNVTHGRDGPIRTFPLPPRVERCLRGLQPNQNPRCLIAIEVCFNGSAKHALGDVLNAGALGLYGIVVGNERMMPVINRNLMYLRALGALDKVPANLLRNVIALSTAEFDALFAEPRARGVRQPKMEGRAAS